MGRLPFPRSIRWRLPLTYAGIALLAAIALGGVLLVTLRQHYDRMERQYLEVSAESVARSAEPVLQDRAALADDVLQSSTEIYSFIVKARVRLLDVEGQVIADSGPFSEENVLSVNVRGASSPNGGPNPEPGRPYETFLSVQAPHSGGPEQAPPSSADAPRYPFRFPPGAADRVMAGFIAGGRSTDLSLTTPLLSADGTLLGYLEISQSPAFGTDIINSVAEKAAVAGLVAVLLAAAAGWIASRQIIRPVARLADTTQRMADGDLSVRVPALGPDEFGLLARTFNSMAERVESTVVTLKRFVADAAHEINTPITALHTNLELAATGETPDEFRADIARAQVELERLETLTTGLLTLSRLEAQNPAHARSGVDLTALVRQAYETQTECANQRGVTLTLDAPESPVEIQGDARQIRRVVDNLLDNALKFTPPGGSVMLALNAAGGQAHLHITDTGIGIPAADLPQLFERFHRGRNTGAYPGHGLGLVICKAIVEDHAGEITIESQGAGTRVEVVFPADDRRRNR